jgi:hypothetical protein
VGQVGEEPAVALDDALERLGLLDRQVVLRPAPGARQVDMLDLVGAVILGAALEMGVADDAHGLQQRQRPVHGRGVDRGEAPLDPTGQVLGGDVPVRAEHLLEDHLALRGDPVPPLAEDGSDGGRLVHVDSVPPGRLQRRCRCRAREADLAGVPPRAEAERLMMPAGR